MQRQMRHLYDQLEEMNQKIDEEDRKKKAIASNRYKKYRPPGGYKNLFSDFEAEMA